jgi:hypothetical protein
MAIQIEVTQRITRYDLYTLSEGTELPPGWSEMPQDARMAWVAEREDDCAARLESSETDHGDAELVLIEVQD